MGRAEVISSGAEWKGGFEIGGDKNSISVYAAGGHFFGFLYPCPHYILGTRIGAFCILEGVALCAIAGTNYSPFSYQ